MKIREMILWALAIAICVGALIASLTSMGRCGEKEDLQKQLTIMNDRAVGIQAMIERATPDLQQRLKDVREEAQPIITRLNEITAAEKKAEEAKKAEKK